MTQARQDLIARLVGEFDWHDPEYTPDVAEDVNRGIRERSGVTYTPSHGGLWILSRHADVRAALKDHETFSSGSGVFHPRAAGMPMFSPIEFDPPEHGELRRLMAPPLHNEEVRRLEKPVRALAADLIDPIVRRGHGDFVAELAHPFAIGVLALAIGLSDRAQSRVRELTSNLWQHLSKDSDADDFWPQFQALLTEEVEAARANPGDHYLSRLAATEIDGEPISDERLHSIIVSLCIAGHQTTLNTLSRMLWYLAGHPELQARLRAEPELLPVVGDETMRRWCPTDRFTRVTTREVVVDGTVIPAGARVVLLLDAANRDPAKFPDPEEFSLERGTSHQHLSFGFGIHHCLGASLARLEFRTVLGELARHPVYHLTEEPHRRFENGRHIVFDAVKVRFEDPAAQDPAAEGTDR
ncbi:cytochrome P450 [Kitasatospora sp. NPDC059673]|uniref:cytochrome P450 n=1 Tax=Kitasatospora sp. NPDC059673 TaxID=3346901 RepID=UPI0036B0349F